MDGFEGIVIADTGNKFSNKIDNFSGVDKTAEFDKLNKLDDVGRGNKIRGGALTERVTLRADVKKKIFEKADTGRTEIIGGKEVKIYSDGKTFKDIPNYGTHYPEFTPLGHKHPKFGQKVPDNLVGQPRADIGHKKNQSWEKRLAEHKDKGHSRKQIIEAENSSNLYLLEERSSNRSRKLD